MKMLLFISLSYRLSYVYRTWSPVVVQSHVVVHVFITVSGHVKISEYFAQTNIPRWGFFVVCAVRKIVHIARGTFMKLRYLSRLSLIKLFFYYLVGPTIIAQAWIECGNKT